jgi:hypothetical protein
MTIWLQKADRTPEYVGLGGRLIQIGIVELLTTEGLAEATISWENPHRQVLRLDLQLACWTGALSTLD